MKKKSVLSFVREISIIIIGVLIALLISNWNEYSNNKNYIEKTKSYIKKEVSKNKLELEKVQEKHSITIDSIQKFKVKNDFSIRDILANVKGLQLPELRNTGLRFFVANKAELIDFETISQLSSIDHLMEFVELKGKILIDFIYAKMESTSLEDKNTLIIHLGELIESEKSLLNACNEYLEK